MLKINIAEHGLFTVDPVILSRAVAALGSASPLYVRQMASGHAGYGEHPDALIGRTALDGCTLIECLIIWVDSGNHSWGGEPTPSELIDLAFQGR